ncbi:MAG TPA: TIGR03086 family metal-binding protein [Thermomicrobiales bacterium]|nr:TIGR03086 family metal-binding protein [Thermomicrobiales bacterium]
MTTKLERYVRALQGLDVVVQQVRDEDLDSVTPCPPWTVRHLLGHIIDGQRQVLAMLRGPGPRPPAQELAELARAAGTAPLVTWRDEQAQTLDTLSYVDLAETVATPGGTMRIDDLLGTATIEPLLHAWDLASAIGVPVELDADAVQATLDQVQTLGDQLAATGMFAPARPWTTSMTPLEHLLALTGRTSRPIHTPHPPRATGSHARQGAPH